MSSPNHPTSNIEDAFSINFPDYLPASPDYEFSLPKKQGHDQSSSSTSTLPQAFEIGESSPEFQQARAQISKLQRKQMVAIRQVVVDSVAIALETQAATIANADNANRNPEPREAHVARKCSYKEFMSCQPFNFKGSEGDNGLIRWFEHTESVFSHSNCTENCKTLLIKKYGPRTEIQKMEDEFYHMTVNANDLKTYVRRFQELETLCPTMVSDFEKLLEAFIGGLPQSIKGNVTASKPQTLEEAINIAQRLIDK
nr:reverse transcriptase domain-containing protein [Tanacetum cinerariifolium]